MYCLVTGAAGFIGGHLVERLLADGHSVIGIDNVYKNYKDYTWYTIDLVKEKNLEKYFRGIDWVFHLAGRSDIVPSITQPSAYHDVNVTGTVRVLEACRKAHVKRFVYIASSTCYGDHPPIPTPETAPIDPKFPYALTKYIGELYALHWARVYKLPVVSLRLFNVYGPRSRASEEYGPVFSTLLAQKLAGKPFTVVGDGTQKRDFTYVSDVVEAVVLAAKSRVVGEVFNVGTGHPQSVNRLVELLGGQRRVHIPKRPGEPEVTQADITKIKKVLGWSPKISFEEGVKIVLAHINDWKDAPVWTPATIKKATKDWFRYLK
ncbi:SDR family oxidoreductase [Candidatus Gottesmanbacteria bacterium]|nr:SDR family oxidoreductase [Candidatus Gottesmanbacteria bacterium]